MYTQNTCKAYTGTKTLKAWPATRGEYNQYRGWTIPANEDPSERGYLVEYEEGGNPNHPDHPGYISWSPADVFERAYRPTPDDWRSRVESELSEMEDRLSKLHAFLLSDAFQALADKQRELLTAQGEHMQGYVDTLRARLETADSPAAPDETGPNAEPGE